VDSSSLPGEAGGVGFVPPLLPGIVPLLLEDFFFPEGEDSGDSGVEGPLKDANLPLISGVAEDDLRSGTRPQSPKKKPGIMIRTLQLYISVQYGKVYINILTFNGYQ
jgi:hypothetical protein